MLDDQGIASRVRGSIAKAIGKIGDREVVPRLVKMLDNKRIHGYVRYRIAEAIGKIGIEKWYPA